MLRTDPLCKRRVCLFAWLPAASSTVWSSAAPVATLPAAPEDEDSGGGDDEVGPAPPSPEHRFLAQHIADAPASSPPARSSAAAASTLPALRAWLRPGNAFQRQLALLASSEGRSRRFGNTEQLIRDAFEKTLGLRPRNSSPYLAEAQSVGTSRQQWMSMLTDVASATLECSRLACSGFFGAIASCIAQGKARPLLALTAVSYDETALWLRASSEMSAPRERSVVKVMQTVPSVAFLDHCGRRVLYQTWLPSVLTASDHCTGEVIAQTLREAFGVPGLERCISLFPSATHLSCNDRASANTRAETALADELSSTEAQLRWTC